MVSGGHNAKSQRNEKIVSQYLAAKKTIYELAVDFNISKQRVGQILIAMGVSGASQCRRCGNKCNQRRDLCGECRKLQATCRLCEKEIFKKSGFCSYKCRAEFKELEWSRIRFVELTCDWCRKTFKRSWYILQICALTRGIDVDDIHNHNNFCCPPCYHASRGSWKHRDIAITSYRERPSYRQPEERESEGRT